MRAVWLVLVGCSFRPSPVGTDASGANSGDPADARFADAADGALDAGPDLTTGLLAWYRMETLPANVAFDASGHAHDGTCTACPSVVGGQVGSGFHFDGSKRVDVTDDAFQTTTGFTIAAWVRFQSLPGGGFACPVGKVMGLTFVNSWELCYDAGAQDWSYVTSPDGLNLQLLGPNMKPDAGQWYHTAMTWDGTTKVLWLDGEAVAQAAANVVFDNHPVTFGGDIDNGGLSSTITGDVDELRIYDHALGSAAIGALAAQN